jgi:N-acetylmuramoyl-L-alanine amidase
MTAGGAGVLTDVPEFEITLELATNVRKRLEAAGVKVVMTRETNDVDLSNAARAAIANEARASLFVRLDADSDPDPTLSGVSTLYPASNPWTRAIAASSKRAAGLVQKRASSATGAVNRGTAERSDVTGFNWAKVPSILVQTGYPSNAVEDRLLGSPGYQDKLSSGIAEGIVAYLKGRK